MSFLPDFLRPSPTYEPRLSEIAAAKALPTDKPFLPPNVDLTFFYGRHGTKKDFEPLAPLLAQADVFVPEMAAWRLSQLEYYSRISQGDKHARKQFEAEAKELEKGAGKIIPFIDAELKNILGSNLRIAIIDYSASDPRAEEIKTHFSNWGLFDKLVPSWTQTLDKIINYARLEAGLEAYRENGMLRTIGPRLDTLITEDPELSQKERVGVVVQQGGAHSFYYQKFEELAAQSDSVTIRSVFRDGQPASVEHFDRLAYSFREGGHATQQECRELAMRALARRAMSYGGIPLVLTNDDRRGLLRKLPPPEEMVERFSVDDIKGFHKRFMEANGQKVRK